VAKQQVTFAGLLQEFLTVAPALCGVLLTGWWMPPMARWMMGGRPSGLVRRLRSADYDWS
jgi:hypothetical protein